MFSTATLMSDSTLEDPKKLIIIQANNVLDQLKVLTNPTDVHSLLAEHPKIKNLILGGTYTFDNGDTLELSTKFVTTVFLLLIKAGDEFHALEIWDNSNNVKSWLSNKVAGSPIPLPTLTEIKAVLQWQMNSTRREISILKALGNNTRTEMAFRSDQLPFEDAIKLLDILIDEKLSNLTFCLWNNNKEIRSWYFGRPRGLQVLKEDNLQAFFIRILNTKCTKLLIAFWQDNIVLHRSIIKNHLSIIQTVLLKTTKETIPFLHIFINDIQDVNSLVETFNWLDSQTNSRINARKQFFSDIIKLRIQQIKTGTLPIQALNDDYNNNGASSMSRALIPYETKQILEQLAVDIETSQVEKVRIIIANHPFLMVYLAGARITVYNQFEQGSTALQLIHESSLKYFTKFIEWKATDLISKFWKAATPEVKFYIAGNGNEQIIETDSAYQLFKMLLILKLSEIALYIFNNRDDLKQHITQKLPMKEVSFIFGNAIQQNLFSFAHLLWRECPSIKQGICTARPPENMHTLFDLLSFVSAIESGNLHEIAATIMEESIVIKTCLSSTLILPKLNQLNSHRFFYISVPAFNDLKSLVNVNNLTDTIELDVQTRREITYVKVTILDENKYTDLLTFIVEAQIKSRFSETVELITQYVSTDTNVEITPSDESNENRSIVNLFEENIALPEELLNILTDANPVSEMHTAADDVLTNDINQHGMREPESIASAKPASLSCSPASPSFYGFDFGYQHESFRLPDYEPNNERSTEEQAYKRMKLGNSERG